MNVILDNPNINNSSLVMIVLANFSSAFTFFFRCSQPVWATDSGSGLRRSESQQQLPGHSFAVLTGASYPVRQGRYSPTPTVQQGFWLAAGRNWISLSARTGLVLTAYVSESMRGRVGMSAYTEIICPCAIRQARYKKSSPDLLTPPSGGYSPSLSLGTGINAHCMRAAFLVSE
jgi:hypothetical protein